MTDQESFDEYRSRTNAVIEQLLNKSRVDGEYLRSLEEKVADLERDCRSKDIELLKVSEHAQNSFQESRQQAEEMMDNMLMKVSGEIKQRQFVEQIAFRLQNENAKLTSDLELCRLSTDAYTPEQICALEGKIQELSRIIEALHDELMNKNIELQVINHKRSSELHAVMNVILQFKFRMDEINDRVDKWHEINQSYRARINEVEAKNRKLEEELAFVRIQSYSGSNAEFDEDFAYSSPLNPGKFKNDHLENNSTTDDSEHMNPNDHNISNYEEILLLPSQLKSYHTPTDSNLPPTPPTIEEKQG